MDVPHNFEDGFFNVNKNNGLPEINKISIDKRIKSLKHMKKIEREIVSLCYREGVLKGFMLEDIQKYIGLKTRWWIELPLLKLIKKKEERENRAWFYRFAQDSLVYIGEYRKHIDAISQYRREIWDIVEDPMVSYADKVKAFSELHKLTRTSVLLIRDLPFISNIARYFNETNGNMNND